MSQIGARLAERIVTTAEPFPDGKAAALLYSLRRKRRFDEMCSPTGWADRRRIALTRFERKNRMAGPPSSGLLSGSGREENPP